MADRHTFDQIDARDLHTSEQWVDAMEKSIEVVKARKFLASAPNALNNIEQTQVVEGFRAQLDTLTADDFAVEPDSSED